MPVQSGYEVLRQSLEWMGANLSVTRRTLTLGSRNSVTGWYNKTFAESTIKMLIVPKPSQITDTGMGSKVTPQGTGFTYDFVEGGDQIETLDGIFYDVTTVEEVMLGNGKIVYHCNLSEDDLGQGETSYIPLLTGAVLYLPLNEGTGSNAYDQTANHNDGTIYGATWIDGKFGKALNFDGSNDYMDVAHSSSLNFERTDPFSIMVWFKRNTTGRTFLGKGQSRGYRLGVSVYGELDVFLESGAPNWIHVVGNPVIPSNIWTLIAVTYDGSSHASGVKIYIDGVPVAMSIYVDSLSGTIQNTEPLRFGRGGPLYAQVAQDEIYIHNRVLGADEIAEYYSSGP